jgi:hypothetical protein
MKTHALLASYKLPETPKPAPTARETSTPSDTQPKRDTIVKALWKLRKP